MLEAALYAALGCATCSALWGCRTAWILLASVAFCLVLDEAGVPFNPVLWMMFDLVVVAALVRSQMSAADCVIIALFLPAWAAYQMPDDERYVGSILVTTAQLLLTAPLGKIAASPHLIRAWWAAHNPFDKLVAHGRLAGA